MRKFLLSLIIAFTTVQANAQKYFGIATSNWSGTNSLYLNPANIADNRARWTIDILSVNGGMDNSLGTLNGTRIINKLQNEGGVNINDVFRYSAQKQFNLTAPYGEVRGPGVMVSINHKHSLALTTRVRVFNQFTNFDQSLFRTVNDPNFSNNTDYNLSSQNFNWTAHMWSEIGLTYGVVLLEKDKHQLKAGVTLRYLGGIGYMTFKGKNLDAHFYSANDSLVANHTDLQYSSNIINNSNAFSNGLTSSDITSRLLGGGGGGAGAGMDIGFVYEYRPNYKKFRYQMDGSNKNVDYTQNMYELRASFAITDIGAITYKNNNFITNFSGNGYLSSNDISNTQFKNFNDFRDYAIKHQFILDTFSGTTTLQLPTTIVAGLDYHLHRNFYVNLTYIGNIVNRSKGGNSYYDQATITPRFDTRLLTIAIPFTYSQLTGTAKVGIGARVSGFFIGSDDVLALVNNHQYGFNAYIGGYVPINKKKIRDRDHDMVSDKNDLCPDIKGTFETHGCPDRDGDGITDKEDQCPDEPGLPEFNGCPDRDEDGVPDKDDQCPDVAGLISLHGCPDRDGDGIPDMEDQCPDKAGPAKFHGCPDTDGDGIPDHLDACPDKPGLEKYHGCPDSDGDGIPDNEDKCPTVPGPVSNSGCPVKKVVIKEEVIKRLAFAATAIQFQTGKATILEASYPILNEVAGIVKDYPDYYMTIDGYTDNVGSPAKNLELSKDRAASVKNYLVSQGIPSSRLVADGHGATKFVASNKTEKGRKQNRRVVMNLKLKD